jgi:hypothetical protein
MSVEHLPRRSRVVDMVELDDADDRAVAWRLGQWVEPASLAEAEMRRAEVARRIEQIQADLGSDTRERPGGITLSESEHRAWRRRALGARATAVAEIARLKVWIKQRGIEEFEARRAKARADREARRAHYAQSDAADLRRAWALLLKCAAHVPGELRAEIAAAVPGEFAPDDGRER